MRPLADYGPEMSPSHHLFIGRFEQSITVRPNRLSFHRHTYYEVFWLNGRGHFFADFREYPIADPTLIFVSPGQVHRWNQEPLITGPMICFTQEFYDGKEPPPSSLLEHPFWFACETPPLLPISKRDVAMFDSLWREIEVETAPSKERDEIIRALLRVVFYKATRLHLYYGTFIEIELVRYRVGAWAGSARPWAKYSCARPLAHRRYLGICSHY